VCSVMRAELATGLERARLLDVDRERAALINTQALAGALAWASGSGRQGYLHQTPEELLVHPAEMEAWGSLAKVWLIGAERDRLAAGAGRGAGVLAWLTRDALLAVRSEQLEWLAVWQAFEGDLAGAERSARESAALPDDADSHYDRRDRQHLAAALALYTSSTSAPVDLEPPLDDMGESFRDTRRELWLHDYGRLLLRAGLPLGKAYFGGDDKYTLALAAASAGDGTSLAGYLMQRRPWSPLRDGDVAAVLPRLHTGRDELARQLAWTAARGTGGALDYHFPFGLVGHAIERRTALRLAGDATETARWDAIYRRHSAMLSDRRKVVALMMWAL
jgi:hypothetical protein